MATPEFDPDCEVKACAFTSKNYRDVYPAIDPSRPDLSQAGKAFAASFARANVAALGLIGRSAEGLAETEKLINKINPETKVLSIVVDVTDEAGMSNAFRNIVVRLGVPHVLVNNAGTLVSLKPIVDTDVDSWWKTQETNVKGTFVATKAFLNQIGASPSAATIINMTSMAAQGVPPGMSSYSPAKLSVVKFTQFLAAEHPTITSISLDPGVVPTDMGHSVPYLAPLMKDTPELSGGTAVWLASGDKSFLSGRYVSVNWNVEELEKRKVEIKDGNLLTFRLNGCFGGPEVTVEGSK
ncbi:hypothetical protein EYZ11_003320 [Aspergillus tanneri]|uniref:Uncharacterized protein n=1 Tax=Aspergillus tanneri TaxID=1220188 RepID=A0A4S3JTM8_9EURO|nr:uncharacterized protein ATNIH1004_001760 [Aspergillus tanneri]KAA8652851.1 hypothetical protein ATNIH1004_001760 [Aspergillus tanneri]THC97211.1 hypothetical protein EYZ11_003320 [Aspergillus tanneri]